MGWLDQTEMEQGLMNYKDYLRSVLDRRAATIASRVASVKANYIDKLNDNDVTSAGTEEDRKWLAQFAKGKGLDIACGDFLIGDALGVDGAEKQIGTDYFNEGDDLAFAEPGKIDFIVTNYLDAFPNPLKVLNEWYRALKFGGGIIALTCRNAESYTDPKGSLTNNKRQSAYTKVTLSQYLYRAGFTKVKVEATNHGTLRGYAEKRADPGNNCPKCGQDRSHLV
jgi:SAM-dependent methyltransferase